jgi:predicted lipoprotein with Yx(FWY)xxD motif
MVLMLAAILFVAGCGEDGDEPTGATEAAPVPDAGEPETAPERPEAGKDDGGGRPNGTTITTGSSQFGTALFDGDQRAVYYFDKEKGSESECYGECAAAWPPVLTDGDPQSDGDASQGLLGTTERDDGKTQVTYDGRPLYYYVDDPKGQILCHNVDEFGGLWLAVQPDGAPFA